MDLAVPNYEGVRVNYKVAPAIQGWFLLRKSLHEPFMSLDIESDTEGGADAILPIIYDFLSKYEGAELPL